MADVLDLPKSMTALVGDIDSAMAHTRNSAREAAISMEAAARYSQESIEAARVQAEVQREFLSDFSQTVESVMNRLSTSTGIDIPGPGEAATAPPILSTSEQQRIKEEQAPPATWTPRGQDEARGRWPQSITTPLPSDEPVPGGSRAEELSSRSEFRQQSEESEMAYLRRMRGMSFSDLRKSAQSATTGYIGERIQQHAAQKAGSVAPWIDPETGEPVTREGSDEMVFLDPEGNIVEDESVIGDATKAYSWAKAGQAVSNKGVTGAIAGSNIGSAALKYAGPAAVAFGAADQIKDFAIDQRQTNLPWQRMMGGDNTEGFYERGRSQLYEMQQSWFGGIGAGTAQEIYQGAAEIFTDRRDLRQLTESFATDLYKQLGVGVQESLDLVATAAATGNEELLGLSDAIHGVTDAADEANVNAQIAQETLFKSYQDVAQFTGGVGAAGIAQVLTEPVINMGPEMQGAAIQFDDTMLREIAATMGVSYNEAVAASMGPEGGGFFIEGFEKRFRPEVGALSGGQEFIQRVEEMTGGKTVTAGERQAFIQELLRDPGTTDVGAITNYMRARVLGPGATQQQALSLAFDMASGQLFGEQREAWQKQMATQTPMEFGKAVGMGRDEDEEGRTADLFRYVEEQVGMTSSGAGLGAMGEITSERDLERFAAGASGRAEDSARAVLEAKRTGQTNPIMEELVRPGRYDSNRRFIVQTEKGPIEVDLGTLQESGFADQLATGEVTISEGRGAGQTVSEYTQIPGTLDRAKSATNADKAEAAWTKSRSEDAEEFEEEGPGGAGGKIIVEMGPGLRELINVRTQGRNILGPKAGEVDNSYLGGGG